MQQAFSPHPENTSHLNLTTHETFTFQSGDSLYTSESDVCGRQILTYKDSSRTKGIKKFLMV